MKGKLCRQGRGARPGKRRPWGEALHTAYVENKNRHASLPESGRAPEMLWARRCENTDARLRWLVLVPGDTVRHRAFGIRPGVAFGRESDRPPYGKSHGPPAARNLGPVPMTTAEPGTGHGEFRASD